jgi:hypothetical protein
MRIIKSFKKFLLESEDTSIYADYNLDKQIEWNSDIADKIDEILKLSKSIRETYKWNLHGRDYKSRGFEFNIKARKFPDTGGIAEKYGISEEGVWEEWNQFLDDNATSFGDGLVEEYPDFFDDWFVVGRSGGWMVLSTKNDVDEDSIIEGINDDLTYILDAQNNLSDEDISDLNMRFRFRENQKVSKMLGLLSDFKAIELSDESEYYMNKMQEASLFLEEKIKDLNSLEGVLQKIDREIDEFWEKSIQSFDSWIEYEMDNRDQ